MNFFGLCATLVALFHSVFAVWPHTPFEAVSYLLRYGYLDPNYSMRTNPSKLLYYSVKNFQKKSLLKVTGELDEDTMHQMQKKRCGVPDFSRETLKKLFHGPDIRITISKRDATQAKWDKTDLTFYIRNYTPDIEKEATDETIKEALQVWADVSRLTFEQVDDESADIIVEFVSGAHGDGVPFDGPGGTLAHAYFPETNTNPLEGDAHFDDDETWVLESGQNGTNLFCTAVHEFGHSLGLSHTYSSSDIMFPYDTGCHPLDFRLSDDDIYYIQNLYGKPDGSVTTRKTTVRPTTTEKPTTPRYQYTNATLPSTTLSTTPKPTLPFPELCEGSLDAITVGADGNVYVFIDYLVFMLDSHGIFQNFYTLISEVFPRAPNIVDSAFSVNLDDYDKYGHASFTYLFRRRKVWKYYFHADHQEFQLAAGYPRFKRRDFQRALARTGAAFYRNGKAYLIDRSSYMEYLYDFELSKFKRLTGRKSIRDSPYFRQFRSDSSINAVCAGNNGSLNVFLRDDWFILNSGGDITKRFPLINFFGCDAPMVPHSHDYPTEREDYPTDKHSPHKHHHSPHKHHHSPHKHSHHHHKHSPHKHDHSPPEGEYSPRLHKHPHKKGKKSKKDKHRKKSPGKGRGKPR